jgi:integrase
MASLTLKKTSPFFFACFRGGPNGKIQCRRSTFETDRRKAQKIADSYETVAQRQITERKIRRTMAELAREVAGYQLATVTLAEYAKRFLAQKKRELKANSFELYAKAVSKLLEFFGKRGDQDINDILKQDIVAWRDSLAAKVTTVTANGDMRVCKMLFKAAKRDTLIEADPCEFVPMLRRQANAPERRPFSIEELKRVLAACDDEWRSLVTFAIYSGQRLADLASLRWSSIDLLRNELTIVTRKTGKRVVVPMSEPLREHVLALPGADSGEVPVHPHAYAILARDGRVRALSTEFATILEKAGLRPKRSHSARGNGRDGLRESLDLSFHALRHTAVSFLRDANVPEAAVMELIGHDSVEISRHYTHCGREALQAAAAALPRI